MSDGEPTPCALPLTFLPSAFLLLTPCVAAFFHNAPPGLWKTRQASLPSSQRSPSLRLVLPPKRLGPKSLFDHEANRPSRPRFPDTRAVGSDSYPLKRRACSLIANDWCQVRRSPLYAGFRLNHQKRTTGFEPATYGLGSRRSTN
jgi:hypothetical protein